MYIPEETLLTALSLKLKLPFVCVARYLGNTNPVYYNSNLGKVQKYLKCGKWEKEPYLVPLGKTLDVVG